jgi:hypothetical protein
MLKQRQTFSWHEIWKDELRVTKTKPGEPFDTKHILNLRSVSFKQTLPQDVFSKAPGGKRYLSDHRYLSDLDVYLRDDGFIYVRSTRGVKRYHHGGNYYDWIPTSRLVKLKKFLNIFTLR